MKASKALLVVSILFTAVATVTSQQDSVTRVSYLPGKIRIDYPDTANAPFIVVDVMPVYPGKEKKMHKELLACVALDSSTHHCDDDVIFQLIVEKDGSVTHPLIIHCQDPDVANALLACIGKLGQWKPGEHNGKPVAVRKTIVLPFKKI